MGEEKPRILLIRPTDDPEKGARMLQSLEKHRIFPEAEVIPYAKNTSFRELAENVIPDRDGVYSNPIYLFQSRHATTIGVAALAKKPWNFWKNRRQVIPWIYFQFRQG